MSRLSCHSSIDEMLQANPGLEARSMGFGVFGSAPWFAELEKHPVAIGSRSLILAHESSSGNFLALPLLTHNRRVESMHNCYSPLYSPIRVGNPDFAEAAEAFVNELGRRDKPMLELDLLTSGDPFTHALCAALRRVGYMVRVRGEQVNWYLDVTGLTWPKYLKERPSRLRHSIQRCDRRLRRNHDVRITISAGDVTSVNESIIAYQSVYANSWKPAEPRGDFISSLCRMASAQGWLRLGVMWVDGKPAAAQIWLTHNGVASIYKLAYHSALGRFGVGTVLTAAMAEHAMAIDHVHTIDFLGGDEGYKSEWMSHRRERVRLVAGTPWRPQIWVGAAQRVAARQTQKLMRPVTPKSTPQAVIHHAPSTQRTVEMAVVVGLCAHGLALVRSLSYAGVTVFALESNPSVPGYATRCAEVVRVADINSKALLTDLLDLAKKRCGGVMPTLILTNDIMVANVAQVAHELSSVYRLSWADCAPHVASLLSKANIETRCETVGLSYPKSVTVQDVEMAARASASLRFPVIVKPTKPLSAFKTIVAASQTELVDRLRPYGASAPYLIQEFVPGGDDCIHFCAMYLEHGKVLAHFEGRKLRSRPMGHTTAAVSTSDSALFDYTQRFFSGMAMSGPVSLEVKRDDAGTMWVIEPTVGRTDFWVGLCIAADLSIPVIEHDAMHQRYAKEREVGTEALWFNAERDPIVFLWLAVNAPLELLEKRWACVYFDWRDTLPWARSVVELARNFLDRVTGRLRRMLGQAAK